MNKVWNILSLMVLTSLLYQPCMASQKIPEKVKTTILDQQWKIKNEELGNQNSATNSINMEENVISSQSTNSFLLNSAKKLPKTFQTRITLNGNASLKHALSFIAETIGYNLMLGPDIHDENVNMRINNIEIWQALNTILYPSGYGFRLTSTKDLLILSQETRIFNLRIPETTYQFTNVMSNESFTNSSSNSSTKNKTSTQSTQQIKVGAEMVSTIVSNVDFWGKVRGTLNHLVSEKGQYDINTIFGKITITDAPQNIDRIEAYIDDLRKDLYRKVEINIRIFKVELSNQNKSGVDLSVLSKNLQNMGALKSLAFSSNFASQNITSGSYATFSFDQNTTNTSILQILKEVGESKLISEPKISMLNGQHGRFNSGTSQGYISQNSTSSTQVSTEQTTTISQAPSVVSMGVIPLIVDGGERIVIKFSVSLSNVAQIRSVGGVEAPDSSDDSIDSVTIVRNGETALTGGLISQNDTFNESKVPVLGDIPGPIGKLFSYSRKKSKNTELIIFITPTIIN